ncbi:hypothetical protein AC249_AIPGENE4274 [Exaiptasia diaphana]|nr:hypothetical protein AC249_AIPGENE4274 [Exaiptasia diaphana]
MSVNFPSCGHSRAQTFFNVNGFECSTVALNMRKTFLAVGLAVVLICMFVEGTEKEIAKKPKNVATEIKTEEKEVEKKTVPQKRQFSKAVLKGHLPLLG